MIEYDKKRYWAPILIWVIWVLLLSPFLLFGIVRWSHLVGLLPGIVTSEAQGVTIIVAVMFLPLLVYGVYGLIQGYVPWSINHILRGRWATVANIFFIVLYFLILLLIFAKITYEQLQ